MRVLHLFKNYYPPTRGGVEQWINDVVHSIDGIDFVVLTASPDRKLVIDDDAGVQVVRAPTALRASTAPVVPSWPGWIGRLRPDVVHVHMPNPTAELAMIASRCDAPIIAHYHADIVRSGPLPALYEHFATRFVRRAYRVVVSSARLAETTPALREAGDRIVVLPFGVDPDRWRVRPPASDDIRARHPGPLVVFLGRLVHYKGIDVLIEAMRTVDATLLVVGDGPLRAGAEAAAGRSDVAGRVRFVGAVGDDERAAYYHAADLFVFPATNRGEAYGIAQVEAMATGTPSISTELGTGTSWVNRHGETGLVVPPSDPRALAAAINELLGDDDRRAAMGRAARRWVGQRLTRDRMLADLRTLYEKAAAAR